MWPCTSRKPPAPMSPRKAPAYGALKRRFTSRRISGATRAPASSTSPARSPATEHATVTSWRLSLIARARSTTWRSAPPHCSESTTSSTGGRDDVIPTSPIADVFPPFRRLNGAVALPNTQPPQRGGVPASHLTKRYLRGEGRTWRTHWDQRSSGEGPDQAVGDEASRPVRRQA